MIASFESLLPVFMVIAAGFMIRKLAIVPADQWRGIELAAFWVFFPALVAETLLKADLASIPVTNVAFALLIGISTMALLLLGLRKPLMRLFALDGPAYTSIFQAVTRWNGFIALPIVAKLFGDPGVTIVALALAAMVPIINMANISVLAIFATHTEPSMNGYILAKQMGGDAPYYATLVMVQTVLSLLAIPLIVWLAQTYGP